jgi:serine/threonine-protein kinase
MSARGPALRPGDVIPGTKYRVVKALGAGGMGVVFQVVKPPNIGGVLKLMSTELAIHEEHRMRFFDEVRILAQLDHPNIVKVFDYDALPDGTPFYVMELLTGRTVRDALCTMGRLPPRVAYEITRQLLEALQCAHTHEIPVIHRDIKPENIFLHAPRHGEPVVKLIDFGVSAVADRKHDGSFVGTWSYAAPEQIRGEPPTPQTDLYAAGLVLYEMLAGVGPFDHYDDWTKVSEAQLHEIPAPVSKFAPWVPPSVVTLIASALAKDPRVRPRDAYAFAEQLFELEWASDGKNPHDFTVEGPSALQTPPQPPGKRRSVPLSAHADVPVHVTGSGPLSYVLSTVTGATPSNKERPAQDNRTGSPWRDIGGPSAGESAAAPAAANLRNEPTSPDANTLLAGLGAEPRKPASKRERASDPELDAASASPHTLRGRPITAVTLDEASAGAPSTRSLSTRDTFSSQQSDTPVILRTRPSAWIAAALGALLLGAGIVGLIVVRGRTPTTSTPSTTAWSVGASVDEAAGTGTAPPAITSAPSAREPSAEPSSPTASSSASRAASTGGASVESARSSPSTTPRATANAPATGKPSAPPTPSSTGASDFMSNL